MEWSWIENIAGKLRNPTGDPHPEWYQVYGDRGEPHRRCATSSRDSHR